MKENEKIEFDEIQNLIKKILEKIKKMIKKKKKST